MTDTPTYPLVLVEWVDSNEGPKGWEYADDLAEIPPIECRTVGHLLDDEPNHITIASSVSPNQILNRITIPRCAVVRMATLVEGSIHEVPRQESPRGVTCGECGNLIRSKDIVWRGMDGQPRHWNCPTNGKATG